MMFVSLSWRFTEKISQCTNSFISISINLRIFIAPKRCGLLDGNPGCFKKPTW